MHRILFKLGVKFYLAKIILKQDIFAYFTHINIYHWVIVEALSRSALKTSLIEAALVASSPNLLHKFVLII